MIRAIHGLIAIVFEEFFPHGAIFEDETLFGTDFGGDGEDVMGADFGGIKPGSGVGEEGFRATRFVSINEGGKT
jgi:hypothetical protein